MRPKKYNTPKALERAIRDYFASISATRAVCDDNGREIRNDQGRVIRRLQYLEPPTIAGLCLALNIDRRTWANYCDREKHPEFETVTAWAQAQMEAYLERELLTRQKGVQGIIFNLQNNYGWKNRQEVELGEKTRRAASAMNMTMEEKLAVIRQAAEAMEAETTDEGI